MARSPPSFFVSAHHGGFDAGILRNQPVQRVCANAHIGDFFDVFFKGKQLGIANNAVLNHFSHPGYQFTARQRAQRIGIYKDELGLVKRTDQVFFPARG